MPAERGVGQPVAQEGEAALDDEDPEERAHRAHERPRDERPLHEPLAERIEDEVEAQLFLADGHGTLLRVVEPREGAPSRRLLR